MLLACLFLWFSLLNIWLLWHWLVDNSVMELKALSQLLSTKIFIVLENTLKHEFPRIVPNKVSPIRQGCGALCPYGLPLSLNRIREPLYRSRRQGEYPDSPKITPQQYAWMLGVGCGLLCLPTPVENLCSIAQIIKAPCQAWGRAYALQLGAGLGKEALVLSAAPVQKRASTTQCTGYEQS